MGGARAAEWEPEHTVAAAEAAALIGTRFPRLRGAPVEELATEYQGRIKIGKMDGFCQERILEIEKETIRYWRAWLATSSTCPAHISISRVSYWL